MASGKPITFKREDWGADESLRFSGGEEIWPRSYVPTKKLVVHHTATGNSYATVGDAKAIVRVIYTYHAQSLGWGDIGYNCLVDKFGNSYEGRRGRSGPGYDGPGGREILSEDVVAGHALAYNYGSSGISLLGTFEGVSPSSGMISRLKDVLAWECRRHGINPKADSDFLLHDGTWHRDLRNVLGHRDVSLTSCPGGNVYALLPQLRSDVAGRLANSAAPTVSITAGPKVGTVTKGNVEFAWKGSGNAVYVMEDGTKRHLTSPTAMDACGYGWDAVRTIPDSLLERIPEGPSLSGPPCPRLSPPGGYIVMGSGSPVYVMRRGAQASRGKSGDLFGVRLPLGQRQ